MHLSGDSVRNLDEPLMIGCPLTFREANQEAELMA
jgi:hypothetical protein